MFGFDEILGHLLQSLFSVGTNLATGAASNAIFGGGGGGASGGGYSGGQPGAPSPGVSGGGTTARPSTSLNFTGGFTGTPPGTGNGGQAPEGGAGGFRTAGTADPNKKRPFESV